MTFAIERLTDGTPVEINTAPPGRPADWSLKGEFSHYSADGSAVIALPDGKPFTVRDLSMMRKRAS